MGDIQTNKSNTSSGNDIKLGPLHPETLDLSEKAELPAMVALAKPEMTIKPTPKRYLILLFFCLNSANKAFQWISLPSMTNKVTYFYDVDNYVINGTSVQFMLSFVLLSWPACNLMERWGQRKSLVLASFGGALGSLVKCFCCFQSGGIYLLWLGQIIVSLGEQLIFSMPNRLASVWFPDHQVSSAVAFSVFGNQLGVALGFLLPQYALADCETKDEIGDGLQRFFVATALFSSALFLASAWLFDEAPKYQPGEARLKQALEEKARALAHTCPKTYWQDMMELKNQFLLLMKRRDFIILSQSYGVNVGLTYTIPTLLNQQLESVFPNNDLIVGRVGFLYILFGALGTPLCGQILDKWHRYLRTNVVLTVLTITAICIYSYSLSWLHSPLALYISACLLGASQIGLLVAGLELAVELTYPSPELATSTMMNVWPQIWGAAFVFLGSHIVDTYGSLAGNGFYLVCLFTALGLLLNIRETLKRQNAVQDKRRLGGFGGPDAC